MVWCGMVRIIYGVVWYGVVRYRVVLSNIWCDLL